jgi:DegV family protein with EDD domain
VISIVTDSSADLPFKLATELGITVVPLYVRFGDKIYREHINITEEEFYQKLEDELDLPVTIHPGIQDFLEVYQELSAQSDGIISIHISGQLSGTYSSAVHAKKMLEYSCPIEIIDSQTTTVALGLIVIAVAQAAKEGRDMQYVLSVAEEAIEGTHLLGLLDSLDYLYLGGRIGRARAMLGSLLKLKPLVSLKNGMVVPAGRARSRAIGIEKLCNFTRNAQDIEDIAIAYSTTPEDAQNLYQRISSRFKNLNIRLTRVGSTIGVHTGPGALAIAYRQRLAT